MLGFGRAKGRVIALIDISSGSVAGAYVHVVDKKPPSMLFSTRTRMEENVEGEIGMLRTLDTIVYALHSAGPLVRSHTGTGSAEAVFVTIGSPWLTAEVKTEVLAKKEPFIITESFINDLLQKRDTTVREEKTILSALLNGYSVDTPLGKRVKEAEFSILTTSIQKEMHDRITQSLRRISPHSTLVPHVLLLQQFATLISPAQKDFLTLFMSEETAEIGMIKRGRLQKTSILSKGTEVFARAAKTSGLSSYTEGKKMFDVDRNDRLADAIEQAEREWLVAFVELLRSLVEHQALPQTVFLMADLASRDFMKRLLGADEIKQLWLSGERATIVPFLPQQLTPHVHVGANASSDMILETLALYAKDTAKK